MSLADGDRTFEDPAEGHAAASCADPGEGRRCESNRLANAHARRQSGCRSRPHGLYALAETSRNSAAISGRREDRLSGRGFRVSSIAPATRSLIQAFIQQHREASQPCADRRSLGTYVRNQPSLGGQRYPDFALAVVDSGGVHWTLIELESPRVNAGLKSGQLAEKARTAVQQIETWREWLTVNLDFARRPRDEDGLGLVEIRPQCPGLVLIGRRASMRQISTAVQRRLLEEHIALHSTIGCSTRLAAAKRWAARQGSKTCSTFSEFNVRFVSKRPVRPLELRSAEALDIVVALSK